MCLRRIDGSGSSSHKFPSVLRSVHCHTDCQVLDKLFVETFFEFKKSRATGLLVSVTPKPFLLRESRIWQYANFAKSKRSTRNWLIKLYLIFFVESIGVDEIRRKRAQHGARSQLFFGRQRESQDQWNPIDSEQDRLNWQQLICPRKTIGMGGNRWRGAQHGASSHHFLFKWESIADSNFRNSTHFQF